MINNQQFVYLAYFLYILSFDLTNVPKKCCVVKKRNITPLGFKRQYTTYIIANKSIYIY